MNASASLEDAAALGRALSASRLRSTRVDREHAAVLAGEPLPEGAPADLRELAEVRMSLARDDAGSRRIVASLASEFEVAAVLVLRAAPAPAAMSSSEDASAPSSPPVARLFLVETGEFDAARYEPDASSTGPDAWRAVVTSLERTLSPPIPSPAPSPSSSEAKGNVLALQPPAERSPHASADKKAFYASPWFWGALGGAALLGAGIYFASQGNDSDRVQLRMQVPR